MPPRQAMFYRGHRVSFHSAIIHYGPSSISAMTYRHLRVIGVPSILPMALPTNNLFLILLKIMQILGKTQVSQQVLL